MEYKEILKKRNNLSVQIDDLNKARFLKKHTEIEINKKINQNKFKYNFYNQLLKTK